MRRCELQENQTHLDELEALIKKQAKELKQYESDVKKYEIYVEYLENLLEKAGIPFIFNGGIKDK